MNRHKRFCVSILIVSLFAMYTHVPPLKSEEAHLLSATFREIRNTSLGTYGIFMLTNTGRHDIDDISLSLSLKNSNGDTLSNMAITDSTIGFVWLKVGQSKEAWIPLDNKFEKAKLLLETNPNNANLEIEVKSITFMVNGSN